MPKVKSTTVIPTTGKKGSVGHRTTRSKRTTRSGVPPAPAKKKGY